MMAKEATKASQILASIEAYFLERAANMFPLESLRMAAATTML
jgi:hypothetical protein